MPDPIYTIEDVRPISHLFYTWTGWPYRGSLFPKQLDSTFFNHLDAAWSKDNLQRISMRWAEDEIQIGFSVDSQISPVKFVSRVKGRLQYEARMAGTEILFSRKVSFRAIGKNHTSEVANYVTQKVDKEDFVDERFASMLKQFTSVDSISLLQQPSQSNSGRYWYNLHLVLVIAGRGRLRHKADFLRLDRVVLATAEKHQHRLVAKAWMPDHLHIAMRGNIKQSPAEIALSLMNNTSYAIGQDAIWQRGFYVGSFSEYDLDVLNRME